MKQPLCSALGRCLMLLPLGSLAGLGGCSVFSPVPLWELAKAGGSLASSALSAAQPSTAVNTVRHPHALPRQVCIEFNRDSQSADLVPALQAELFSRGVPSRVYDAGSVVPDCTHWLRYQARIDWGVPPLGNSYRPFLESATLALSDPQGRLLATSSFQLEGLFSMGRWADSRAKLQPAVQALLGLSDDRFSFFRSEEALP
ncbi:MAG: cell division protein FtsI [Burkholderiales bacterium PBB6]|nr:MAG: cell division protein FtsI [Burkholderiales bacterium PBB6]